MTDPLTATFLAWLAAAPITELEDTRKVCVEYRTCDAVQLLAVQDRIRAWMNGERTQ